jgi:tetratricopeptide (TPR) repeat protein
MNVSRARVHEGLSRREEVDEEEKITESTIAAALAFHLQGRFSEAERLYRKALRRPPDAVAAIQGLGALEYQRGRMAEAIAWFERGVAIRPQSGELRANLGEALRIQKRLEEAMSQLHEALALDSLQADAWNSLGMAEYDQGHFDRAEAAHREAIRLRPDFAAPHVNLGITLQASGRLAEGSEALRKALRIEPHNPLALTNLGLVLCEMNNPDLLEEAAGLCRRAVAAAPRLYQAHNNLGNALRLMGRFDEALSCFQEAMRVAPHAATPRQNMGRLFQQRGNYHQAAWFFGEAVSLEPDWARYHANCGGLAADQGDYLAAAGSYRLALESNPHLAEAQHGLGRALLEQGRLDEAEHWLRAALRENPRLAEPWVMLARLQAERGDFDLSCQSARAALKTQPMLADAYWQLTCNLTGDLPDADLQAVRQLLERKYLPDGTRAMLQFGLASVLDARRRYAEAAALLETANTLQYAARAALGRTYDPDLNCRFVDRVIATFTPQAIARTRGWCHPDPRPVFVVGLPRSGTTLVEQILASHPQVVGLGELPDVRTIFRDLPQLVGHPELDPCDALKHLNPDLAQATARRYLERVESVASPTPTHVVDKMPDNFRFLGLIAILWPGARLIVCSRDLRDIALSCWQTWFASIDWANDWGHIARRLADHQRLFQHWRCTSPAEWLHVRYEELVRDLEGHAQRLIDFVNLPWDPACLEFHRTRRVVRTASLVQVRRAVNARSIGRWRHYETTLQPLFRAWERLGFNLTEPG